MHQRLGIFLAVVLLTLPVFSATRSSAIGIPAIQVEGAVVRMDSDALAGDSVLVKINGDVYRSSAIDREASGDAEVLRFRLPGALTSSTVTRIGDLTAASIVTPKASYRVRPATDDPMALVLEDRDTVAPKDLANDVMTAFDVAVRTGNFAMLSVQPLTLPTSTRQRAVNPFAVEHRNIALYSARFAAHYGSADKVKLAIQHCLDVRDTALRDSNVVGIHDSLVYIEERNDPVWLATSHVLEKVARFGDDSEVQKLRVQYQANAGYWDDDPAADAGGGAAIFSGQSASWVNGIYAIEWREALERVVAHELGHVGGGDHDKKNASGAACLTCYGWYNDYFRDLMAVACGEMDCHQIYMYSTPTLIYHADFWDFHGDVVPGSAEENVARRLSETRYDVRDFWKQIH